MKNQISFTAGNAEWAITDIRIENGKQVADLARNGEARTGELRQGNTCHVWTHPETGKRMGLPATLSQQVEDRIAAARGFLRWGIRGQSAMGKAIESELTERGIAYQIDWEAAYTHSVSLSPELCNEILDAIEDRIHPANPTPAPSRICKNCGGSPATGAMFTTARHLGLCDDCV